MCQGFVQALEEILSRPFFKLHDRVKFSKEYLRMLRPEGKLALIHKVGRIIKYDGVGKFSGQHIYGVKIGQRPSVNYYESYLRLK